MAAMPGFTAILPLYYDPCSILGDLCSHVTFCCVYLCGNVIQCGNVARWDRTILKMYECLSSGTRFLQNSVNKIFNIILLKFVYTFWNFYFIKCQQFNYIICRHCCIHQQKYILPVKHEIRFYSWQSCWIVQPIRSDLLSYRPINRITKWRLFFPVKY
jgi:hypothetical protein